MDRLIWVLEVVQIMLSDHSLSQSGQAIYSLRNIGSNRLYISLNQSAVIAAAELLAVTKKGRSYEIIKDSGPIWGQYALDTKL